MIWFDWLIIVATILLIVYMGRVTQRYMQGVSDFLAANRCAGRYMLTIGTQVAGTGLISVIAGFEMCSVTGFTGAWWGLMSLPLGIIVALTGFVFYRYRETRALTLAQFFEVRYSGNFRRFAGLVCFLTGIINFGVFPAISARFYVHYAGLPAHFSLPGLPFEISTFATVMFLDLAIALGMVLLGGQISVMVTDCVQGIITLAAFVLIGAVILFLISWGDVAQAVSTVPADKSMIHPMKGSGINDFNVWYFIIGILSGLYTMAAWQGHQAYNACALNPHEQKMGNIIGQWRWPVQGWMSLVMAVGALAILTQPQFSSIAATVNAKLAAIENTTVQGQMRVPLVMAQVLPVGIKGLFFATMIFLSITTHNTYMHSWGSIFIQDVFIPLRRKVYSERDHLRLLRWAVLGVGVYAFVFGLFHTPNTPVLMYWAITGTIWLPGAGAAVIGGLYWKRGTTSACYPAIAFGVLVGFFGLIYPPIYKQQFGVDFPINSQVLFFIAMLGSGVLYIVVSLITSRGRAFNLDKMLHRGEWAIRGEHQLHPETKVSPWQRLFGINKEFSRTDRILAIAAVIWNIGWFGWFILITILNVARPFANAWWMQYWRYYIWFFLIFNSAIAVWFTFGGIRDIRRLLVRLATIRRDATDDGRVVTESPKDTPASAPVQP